MLEIGLFLISFATFRNFASQYFLISREPESARAGVTLQLGDQDSVPDT